jgi:hypothetical protein
MRQIVLAAFALSLALADVIAHFGKPTETNLVTDGGGVSYSWTLRQIRWKTGLDSYLGPPGGDCAGYLSIGELR